MFNIGGTWGYWTGTGMKFCPTNCFSAGDNGCYMPFFKGGRCMGITFLMGAGGKWGM